MTTKSSQRATPLPAGLLRRSKLVESGGDGPVCPTVPGNGPLPQPVPMIGGKDRGLRTSALFKPIFHPFSAPKRARKYCPADAACLDGCERATPGGQGTAVSSQSPVTSCPSE